MGQPPLISIAGTTAMAAFFGVIALRATGLGFLMITLALSQVLWGLAYRMSGVTNGDNGIAGLTRPMPFGISLDSAASFYWFALIVASFAFLMMAIFVSSSFGSSLKGVRDQPRRMAALGFNPWMIRWITFVYAGFWGGVSGLLYVYYNKYIHPTSLSTTSSAEALLGVIAGGSGTLGGPVVGAALVLLLKNYASAYVERWNMLLGLVFLFIVLVMPTGIVPGVEQACGGTAQGIAMTPLTSDYALEVINLKKAFGGLAVTQDVSLAIRPGERRLIIGPNGAGKTTLFNQISGDLRPNSGADQAVRHRRHAFRALQARAFRTVANLPDHHAVRGRHARTQRHARPARLAALALADVATVVGLRRSRHRGAAHPRCRRAAASGRPSGVGHRLWRKAPRRTRDGAGAKAAGAAAGRAARGTFEHRAIHR